MIYEKSVIPIIESKYTLFTNTEKKIADYFLQCDPGMDISIQGNYESLSKDMYKNITVLNTVSDRGTLVKMVAPNTVSNAYIEVATATEDNCNFITEKNINISEYKNADNVSFVLVKNIRKKLGIIASNYYGYPQNKIKIIGITGTNGKTTSSFILENILEKTARIGTTGNRILDEEFETVNTTPESLELIKLIDKSVKKGADYFIMEVSSHALEIGRVDMLKFDSAIFTNLTQDHLDFHKTIENYFNAKKKIFSMLRNDKNNGKGIVNIDDEHGAKIYSEKNKDDYISVSIKNEEADILGDILNYTNNGMKVKINLKNYFKKINSNLKNKDEAYEEEYKFEMGLVGEYNLYNVLGCVASALSFGIKMNDIIKKLETMSAVPGRFETIKNNIEARIVVDFAHTDDGLLNVGKTLKQITDNQVITIFGAGGDRDHEKRPKMAKAAIQFSDYIILTSDNPRTENPINILADIEKGLIDEKYPFDKYLIISDRERAIKHGIKLLKKGDSLLIAGKGHENYQIIGTQKIHFDDRETVRKILEEKFDRISVIIVFSPFYNFSSSIFNTYFYRWFLHVF